MKIMRTLPIFLKILQLQKLLVFSPYEPMISK
jgi:hypothetical protein